VIRLDREQAISVGVLAALLVVCLAVVGVSLLGWSDAAHEFDDRRSQLVRLEARAKARDDARARSGAAAPAAAFLDAPTQGLAVAQLQAHLLQLADAHHCLLVSSGLEPTKREDGADQIRLQATVEASSQSLQAFLYQLESGTPYVFVDTLTVQLTGAASSQRTAEDPLLRVTFGLHAVWRRGAA
jgi:general secretion pathway protein M